MTDRTIAALIVAAAIGLAGTSAHALDTETVQINSPRAGKGPFTAVLARPQGPGPFAAIVALHGCGGLLTAQGNLRDREEDWAERLVAAGYVVLLPDSFTARGRREICSQHERSIVPQDRAQDAWAAAEWLARQAYVDKDRLGLMGWSHGAMTVLWTVRDGFMTGPVRFRAAIALYPGCREVAKMPDWRPAVPLALFIGGSDDWTAPGPCRELAQRAGFRYVEYPGAYHSFDSPHSPVRIRRGIGSLRSGQAHVGTNPAARKAAIADVTTTFAAALRPQ